jgi:hypothetical protein
MRVYKANLVGMSMQEILINEFKKPTLAEIKKAKLGEYEERSIEVTF